MTTLFSSAPSATPLAPVVEAHDLWKSFDNGRIPVIRGADLSVAPGEIVALWGSSGSGKSTLLHLLSGLDAPDSGTVSILGLDPALEENRLRLRRTGLGFVFQLHHLVPDLTVEENLRLPAVAAGAARDETTRRIGKLLNEIGLEERSEHRVQDLSGGERQRVAICRALVNRPRIVFADEPTGSLDEPTADGVFARFCHLAKKEGIAIILATHEKRFLAACHRVLRVQEGRAVVQ